MQFVIFSHTLARYFDGSGVAAAYVARQSAGASCYRGNLPTGSSSNMSVEPTTLPQGIAVIGSGFDLGQDQASNNTGVLPTASLSSVSPHLLCHLYRSLFTQLGGNSNKPFGIVAMNAVISSSFTTSAYLAWRSHRVIAWLDCARSKHPSSTTATR